MRERKKIMMRCGSSSLTQAPLMRSAIALQTTRLATINSIAENAKVENGAIMVDSHFNAFAFNWVAASR